MRTKIHCYALLVAVLAIPTPGATLQTDESPEGVYLLNLPSSPLQLTASANRRFLNVENHSGRQVRSYRLGCVIERRSGIKLLAKFARDAANLAPQGPSGEVHLAILSAYGERFKLCRAKAAKLAVVEVRFSDGSVWKAKRAT